MVVRYPSLGHYPIKHGEKLDDEAHGRLVVLVAEIERMTPA
jgi:hypothetical protein